MGIMADGDEYECYDDDDNDDRDNAMRHEKD